MRPNSYTRDAVKLFGAAVLTAVGPTVTQIGPNIPQVVLITACVTTIAGLVIGAAILVGLFFRIVDDTARPCACRYCSDWERLAKEADERTYTALVRVESVQANVSSIARTVGAHQAELILGDTLTACQRERLQVLSNAEPELDERVRRTYNATA